MDSQTGGGSMDLGNLDSVQNMNIDLSPATQQIDPSSLGQQATWDPSQFQGQQPTWDPSQLNQGQQTTWDPSQQGQGQQMPSYTQQGVEYLRDRYGKHNGHHSQHQHGMMPPRACDQTNPGVSPPPYHPNAAYPPRESAPGIPVGGYPVQSQQSWESPRFSPAASHGQGYYQTSYHPTPANYCQSAGRQNYPSGPGGVNNGQQQQPCPSNVPVCAPPPNQNPQFHRGKPEPWTTHLFDCFSDPASCVITACAPCVTFGQVAEIVNEQENSCAGAATVYAAIALLIGVPCIYSYAYRTRMRVKYNLAVEPLGDFFTHCLFECCAICQEYRELKNRGMDPALGFHARNYNYNQPNQGMAPPPPEQMHK